MDALPAQIDNWFATRGWQMHPHQRAMLRATSPAQVLIAPTGAGKTLSGFLPSLVDLIHAPKQGLHTLYISPLKALAADIRRNLQIPVADMGLDIRIEDRTGDTSAHMRRRQRADPPQILLTTPESLALLLSYPDADKIFASVKRVILDEIHALIDSKRGDQLMLCLARLARLSPQMTRVGLSATVKDPSQIAAYLAPDSGAEIITAPQGPAPDIAILEADIPPPWAGGGGRYGVQAVYNQIKRHRATLIFHNTRANAELFFHELWQANEDTLPIGIHHGALSREARAKVEAAMSEGSLRAIVCTGSLDLGIDWGDVDLVIQIGAPKEVKRLVQRIGRAGHRFDLASKARILPANRFEYLECQAALEAVRDGELEDDPIRQGGLDVLCQHILICACAGPIAPDDLYAEITSAAPYAGVTRAEFDRALEFCATGGYALRAYDRWQRLVTRPDGTLALRDPRSAARIRQNIGTIIETDRLKVRMAKRRGGAPLGEVEENFAAQLRQGDSFLIGGQIVRYEGMRELVVEVSPSPQKRPKIATFMGTKFATSLQLSDRILARLESGDWSGLPAHIADWLDHQTRLSRLPQRDRLLVETYPHEGRAHLCVHGFAGRNAQQTLGLVLTHRMDQLGLAPMGFVANDYATLIWGLDPIADPRPLFAPDLLRAAFEGWLSENAVMKRSFKAVALISGLIERSVNGTKKTGRQAVFSSDILYDTLRKYDSDHILLEMTRRDALRGLVDFGRIDEMLARVGGRIDHIALPRVSPFAAPLLLEAGRIPVHGSADQRLLEEEAAKFLPQAALGHR
ncbi:ligase-associated DNA damage response DEXH box helicase [Roseobacter sp. HKCC-CH-9208]|uniref:ligase-associated DNA damage response DEXH box helicase n=1 Tax=Roseobacter sp. HKCC-CH-9208 TaxID=3120339 RepID=UPI0030EC5391